MQKPNRGMAFLQPVMVEAKAENQARPFIDAVCAEGQTDDPWSRLDFANVRVYGVGLHGWLSAGAIMAVVPNERRPAFDRWFNNFGACAHVLFENVGPLDSEAMIVHPGEVIRFDPAIQGVSTLLMQPWSGAGGIAAPSGEGWQQTGYNWRRTPMVRIYTDRSAVQDSIGWVRAASRDLIVPNANAPTLQTQGVFVPPGSRKVAIAFQDNAANTRIVGAESNTYAIWWMGKDGIWHHNGADDWIAGELGQADATHDIERYDVDADLVKVYIQVLGGGGGNNLWCSLIFA